MVRIHSNRNEQVENPPRQQRGRSYQPSLFSACSYNQKGRSRPYPTMNESDKKQAVKKRMQELSADPDFVAKLEEEEKVIQTGLLSREEYIKKTAQQISEKEAAEAKR